MNVLIATAADQVWSRRLRAEIEAVARLDKFGDHILVQEPRAADLILFVDAHQQLSDWTMRALRSHPFVRQWPERAFVYDERDLPRDLLPGVYVSMPRPLFEGRRHGAFGYYHLKNDTRVVRQSVPDLLFSFQGRRVNDYRDSILDLAHPNALIEDTSDYDVFAADRHGGDDDRRASYREVVGRSQFVLCPRGAGTSSFRLYEALAAGRVPVVLSDDWVEPAGIDWSSCSVRVPESEAMTVPGRLEDLEGEWLRMSAAARNVYDEWFAPDVWFHRVIEQCRELRDAGSLGVSRYWARPEIMRDGARHWKHLFLGQGRAR